MRVEEQMRRNLTAMLAKMIPEAEAQARAISRHYPHPRERIPELYSKVGADQDETARKMVETVRIGHQNWDIKGAVVHG